MAVATANHKIDHASVNEPWCLPGLSLCKQPRVVVKECPRRIPELPGLGDIASEEDDDLGHVWDAQPSSRLLCLPLEIRMHIYELLHLMSPAPFLKIKSLYPTPTPRRCLYRPLVDEEASPDEPAPARQVLLLSPDRPSSGLPTALLLVSKQVYAEARGVPMASNEFVYVNWFSSGVWAAHFFTRHLPPWQGGAIRFVRLEMLAAELADDAEGIHRWTDVCERWAHGLRGLRLRVVGGRGPGIVPVRSVGGPGDKVGGDADADERARRVFGREMPCRAWLTEGLARLRALDQLELELALPGWTAKEKLAWCGRLEEVLRELGMRTVVVCVERVVEG